MSVMSMSKAINQGLFEEMKRDERVIVMGEDAGVMGSPFGVLKGLYGEFGTKRVIETPISENSFTGMAVGAAARGYRPVVELMYADFVGVAFDQVMNQASKMRYMSGGQVSVPFVLRCPTGTGRYTAGQHTQSLEAMFTHIPGLKVVSPSTPAEAKGMIKTAIRDDDPVIFMEQMVLYAEKGEVPDSDEFLIPFGKADIKRTGKDVTILTWSSPVHYSLKAAEKLAAEGIDAEVIDLRSLVPLDWDCVKQSLEKTHRIMIVEQGIKRNGVGAELSAQIMEDLFDELDAPVVRLAHKNVVMPYSPKLADTIIPNQDEVYNAVKKMLGKA